MTTRRIREVAVLAVPVALAVLTFWLTRDATSGGGGQTSPGAFPRLVAGVMGTLAFARIFLPITHEQSPNHADTWNWPLFSRSMATAALMGSYIYAFPLVPFLPLTLGFLFIVFLIFGIRPLWKTAVSAAGATAFLYVLFLHVLGISV